MARLRRKLEADPESPWLIKTVRGVGYSFCRGCEVRALIPAASAPGERGTEGTGKLGLAVGLAQHLETELGHLGLIEQLGRIARC